MLCHKVDFVLDKSECGSDYNRCSNGRCFHDVQRCDGERHCSDGADEDGCGRIVLQLGYECIHYYIA